MDVQNCTFFPDFPGEGEQVPLTLACTSDTSIPHTIVPVFLIHSLKDPFCDNPQCVCQAEQSGSAGVTRSEQRRYFVEPARFTTLKRGGEIYNFQVEAIVYKGGHLFEDGLPFKLLTFNQR